MTRLLLVAVVLMWALIPTRAVGQVLPSDPADSGRLGDKHSTALGPSPGDTGSVGGDAPGDASGLILMRPGKPGPRISAQITHPGRPFEPSGTSGIVMPTPLRASNGAPLYGLLELPEGPDDLGPVDGLTLDRAIEALVRDNLELRTQFFEIPQAEADILTAGLRANPLFYADSTAVPYGSFSDARPGGQTQYDVGVTLPFDVTRKRVARKLVAARAKRVLEAQYQDAVRLQIDNLCTAFVDVLTARETVRFYRASLKGLGLLLQRVEQLQGAGQRTTADVNLVRIRIGEAEIGYRDAFASLRTAKRKLGVLLNIPAAAVDGWNVRGSLRVPDVNPPPDDQLLAIAFSSRPDLCAFRLGVGRAEADVALARANRISDVYVTYFPYVFQNNAPFHTLSATSWSAAVTVPIPLYNRNQGNIARARLNVSQTKSGLAALEQRVTEEVLQAEQEYDLTREAVRQIERQLIPAARQVRDSAYRQFTGGESNILTYLDAQRDFNDTVRQYRDTLARHRRSMLELNTALGVRALP